MKFLCASLALLIFTVTFAHAADEKIDPQSYICAELIAANIEGQPPIYEALQLDGYYSAKKGLIEADSSILAPMLIVVSDSCASQPTETALSHWEKARDNFVIEESGIWDANKFTCADYAADPDEGSGFVIWLDAYNRAKTGKSASVLESQEAIDNFLEVCKKNPKRLMLDIINETAK